jgi:hypothetical protein
MHDTFTHLIGFGAAICTTVVLSGLILFFKIRHG